VKGKERGESLGSEAGGGEATTPTTINVGSGLEKVRHEFGVGAGEGRESSRHWTL